MSIWGSPVLLGGGGGGGAPVLTRAEWNALTTEQKQSYGLVGIQEHSSGFVRGTLVNGADYIPFEIIQTGTGASTASFTAQRGGSFKLFVLALNSEASTYSLDIAVTQGGAALSGAVAAYNEYHSSGSNRRNYRLMLYDVSATAGDTFTISLSNVSRFTSLVYVLMLTPYTTPDQLRSTADAVCSGSNAHDGMVLYGTFNSNTGGTILAEEYTAEDIIITEHPGNSYRSAYIFWFT
jgi:hypothetical protein